MAPIPAVGFQENLVIFLMGPTASGKTSIALELADRFPVNIISVDSAQVYRHLNIGTAKPSPEVLERYPHRLIDICSPWEIYSAGQFQTDASEQIQLILQHGRTPLLVGGTMFYFRALERGLSDLPARSKSVRQQLRKTAAEQGWAKLHIELAKIDPISAGKVSVNDSHRIERLLELHYLTKKIPADVMQESRSEAMSQPVLKIAIMCSDRSERKEHIQRRLRAMIKDGLLEEAEYLFQHPNFDRTLPAMRSIGYKQIWDYFAGEVEQSEMIDCIVNATSNLAKRQITWIRNSSDIFWVVGQQREILTRIEILLDRLLFGRV